MLELLLDNRSRTETTSKTRSLAVARIADRTGCQWHSRSSKINDFYASAS